MAWNGLDLVTEYATKYGDTSTTSKTRVLGWLNDVIQYIGTNQNLSCLRAKGKKILTVSQEEQSLIVTPPAAPTLAALAGGTLVSGTSYKVACTYYESVSGLETKLGSESASIIPATTNLSITATIPVSTDGLVTARRIYLSKAGGEYYFYSEVANNTATSTTITADTTSTLKAKDYNSFRILDGHPFIEGTGQLKHMDIDSIRRAVSNTFTDGTPIYFSALKPDRIIIYPRPSTASQLSFYYFRRPDTLYNLSTSYPDLPIEFKEAISAGMMWKSYEFKNEAGQESKLSNFQQEIMVAAARISKVANVAERIVDVMGDCDGRILS